MPAFLMSRREALGSIGLGLLAPHWLAAQSQPPEFVALDHVEFYVSDVEKSRDLYVRIFGNVLRSRGAKRYLQLGASYMAFEPPRGNSTDLRVDHVSAAIKRLDMPKLHSLLEARGVAYQDYPSGRDTGVTDPEGFRLQLSPENGWSLLNPSNFPPENVTMQEEPIFQPSGLDHVLLNVSDPEKAAGFYEKIFGPPNQRNNNRIWFQVGGSRIGLLQTPPGQRAGVNHFCVSAAAFNYDAVVRRLQQAGVKVEAPEVAGA